MKKVHLNISPELALKGAKRAEERRKLGLASKLVWRRENVGGKVVIFARWLKADENEKYRPTKKRQPLFHKDPNAFKVRFLQKTLRLENGCLEWMGARNERYGKISINRSWTGAHRVSYQLFRGPIPEAMEVCHSCDNGFCVNPDHLWLGTHTDNMRDMSAKGRSGAFKGEKHRLAKLTSADIPVIFAMSRSGVSARDISEHFHVNNWTINNVLLGKTWRHAVPIEAIQHAIMTNSPA